MVLLEVLTIGLSGLVSFAGMGSFLCSLALGITGFKPSKDSISPKLTVIFIIPNRTVI